MAEKIIFYGFTECGPNRNINQDAFFMKAQDGKGIFIVADGMGGHSNGEIASAFITSRLSAWAERYLFSEGRVNEKEGTWTNNNLLNKEHVNEKERTNDVEKNTFEENADFSFTCDLFENTINSVNEQLRKEYCQEDVCGSTLVALIFMDDKFASFSVGDSRIYRKTKKEFMQITQDHVWQNMPDVINAYSERQKKKHPDFGKLTNAMGAYDHVKISIQTGKITSGDIFMLCSDGVYKCYSDFTLKRVFKHLSVKDGAEGFEKTALSIKSHVEKKGAPDNFTAIIVGQRG